MNNVSLFTVAGTTVSQLSHYTSTHVLLQSMMRHRCRVLPEIAESMSKKKTLDAFDELSSAEQQELLRKARLIHDLDRNVNLINLKKLVNSTSKSGTT